MKLYLNILYIKQLDFILFVFNNLKLKIRYIIDKINIYIIFLIVTIISFCIFAPYGR